MYHGVVADVLVLFNLHRPNDELSHSNVALTHRPAHHQWIIFSRRFTVRILHLKLRCQFHALCNERRAHTKK